MEADLQRFYGVDYRDRWRWDAEGRRLLTLRRLYVLLHHLPDDAALVRATWGDVPLSRSESLLADIWAAAAHSKTPHPVVRREQSRGKKRRSVPTEKRRKLADARRRRRQRLAAIERGEIT